MKRLLLIVLPLLLIVGCSKPISEETLIDKDGLKYHPETKELYSGEVFTNFMGGKPKLEGSYKDGLMNGNWVGWYENGQKEWEGKYKNGDGSDLGETRISRNGRNGIWTFWYENGQKKREINYKYGKEDGSVIEWYKNGQKSGEGTYINGKPDRLVTQWSENGQKESEVTYKDGEVISEKYWNEDGSVKE